MPLELLAEHVCRYLDDRNKRKVAATCKCLRSLIVGNDAIDPSKRCLLLFNSVARDFHIDRDIQTPLDSGFRGAGATWHHYNDVFVISETLMHRMFLIRISGYMKCSSLYTTLPEGTLLLGQYNGGMAVGLVRRNRIRLVLSDYMKDACFPIELRICYVWSRQSAHPGTRVFSNTRLWRVISCKYPNFIGIEDARQQWAQGRRHVVNNLYYTVSHMGVFIRSDYPIISLTLNLHDLVVQGRSCALGTTSNYSISSQHVFFREFLMNVSLANGVVVWGFLGKDQVAGIVRDKVLTLICSSCDSHVPINGIIARVSHDAGIVHGPRLPAGTVLTGGFIRVVKLFKMNALT